MAVGPGRVDTDMQAEIRNTGSGVMSSSDYENFVAAHEDGILHPPEKPGEVIAKLSVDGEPGVSGKYVK